MENTGKFVLSILPSLLLVVLLLIFFPNTGLGRILALPMIFMINAGLIIGGLWVIHNKISLTNNFISWFILIFLTLIVTILLYPQEYGPPVFIKIVEIIGVLLNK